MNAKCALPAYHHRQHYRTSFKLDNQDCQIGLDEKASPTAKDSPVVTNMGSLSLFH